MYTNIPHRSWWCVFRYFVKREGFYTKNIKIQIWIIKSRWRVVKNDIGKKNRQKYPSGFFIDLENFCIKKMIWGKYAIFLKKLANSSQLIVTLALFYAYMITSFDYYSQPASLSCCCQSVFDFSLCTPKDIFTKKYLWKSIQIEFF